MNWLFPGFLAGGLMVGLPVLLHFLRSKPKDRVRFPTLRFLGATALRDTRKHRLRRWLTLALRMLVIGLLAAAFARPFWKSAMNARRRVVVVAIDNSMSMQAKGRWEPMRQWALAQLDDLKPGDQAGLLLMNPTPSWLLPVTDDLERVRSTLGEAEPGYETTRYPGALRMAGAALESAPARSKTLVWMADEQRLGWLGASFDQRLPAGVKMHFPDPPPPVKHQAAITSLSWLPGTGKPEIEANVRLYEPDVETRRITVSVAGKDGPVVAQQEVQLRRDGENRIKLSLDIPPGTQPGGFRVSLESLGATDEDDLAAANTAWVAASPHTGMPVLFEPGKSGADFLAHALGSTRKLADNVLEAVPFPAGEWPAEEVAILRNGDDFAGERLSRLDHFAAAGGALWIFADGSEAQGKWLAAHDVKVTARDRPPDDEEPWHLRDWDPEHPVLAAFAGGGLLTLMDIEFYKGFNIEGENVTPLADWPDGAAAIVEWNFGGHRMFLCGFPPEREATDWMARPSFVPFVHQAVRWLSAVSATRADLRVGDTISLPAQGVWHTVDSPRMAPPVTTAWNTAGGQDAWRNVNPPQDQKIGGNVRPDAPGLYEFTDGNQKQHFYAVNVPPEESDLAPWPDLKQLASLESNVEAGGAGTDSHASLSVSDEAAESQQRTWWWLLAFCCLAMFAELALSNRTAM